jgi:hypothetical protein
VSDAKKDTSINPTPATDHDVKVGHSVTIDSQSTDTSGRTGVRQPGGKRRKRDRVGSAFRKMLPGAGFIAGLAFVGERIWEIVENVS